MTFQSAVEAINRDWRENEKRRKKEKKEKYLERSRIKRHKRRSIITSNGGSFTLQQWEEIKDKYHRCCAICKRHESERKLTMDHILAISVGGSNSIDNIQPLCKSCNSSKGAR